ncbi:hypothetical protein Taro_030692 [Colocasia esculenta]|uniref:RNase H type-1 domain-containing protein n=1 Tax=Colocasia esculenta TaxID=4460 RepID=A0A843W432_COLES|nr:hypothetical protein [Colocasia esculenta]
MVKRYSVDFVAIAEPMVSFDRAVKLSRFIKMEDLAGNLGVDSKIWVFWWNLSMHVVSSSDQQISFILEKDNSVNMMVTLVYASCEAGTRRLLFDELIQLSNSVNVPWFVGGDFNCVSQPSEKMGGRVGNLHSMLDFNAFINAASHSDDGFIGSPFTWPNNRTGQASIKAWLDPFLVSSSCEENFRGFTVRHLPRGSSDHAPLLLSFVQNIRPPARFTFQAMWTSHESFYETVKMAWNKDPTSHPIPFTTLFLKLKTVKQVLRDWNKCVFGNVEDNVISQEEVVRVRHDIFDNFPSLDNRSTLGEVSANLRRAIQCLDVFWAQKACMNWLEDGDRNTAFYHNVVQGNRRKNLIKRLQINGIWSEDHEALRAEAARYFEDILRSSPHSVDDSILQVIPSLISDDQNVALCAPPTMEEVKSVVWSMNGNSSPGPGGFSGIFFTSCWGIIQHDVFAAVNEQYASSSGQTINSSKSSFMVSSKASPSSVHRIQEATGYRRQVWALPYLGVPLRPGRVLAADYKSLIDKDVLFTSEEDRCFWAPTPSGIFSTRSTYNLVREHGIRRLNIHKIWHNSFSPRASLFCWKILNRAVPVDSRTMDCGIPLASRCSCCLSPQAEDLNHLFLHSGTTTNLWRWFMPLVRSKQVKLIRWIPPIHHFCLNVDGASKGNPGICGGGGCIRDTKGDILVAFAHFYGEGNSIIAETHALCDGLRLADQFGVRLASVYSDSLTLVNSVKDRSCSSWRSYRWWRIASDLLHSNAFPISHVFRESNQVADRLANHVVVSLRNDVFWGVHNLPSSCKASVVLDKSGLMNVRGSAASRSLLDHRGRLPRPRIAVETAQEPGGKLSWGLVRNFLGLPKEGFTNTFDPLGVFLKGNYPTHNVLVELDDT